MGPETDYPAAHSMDTDWFAVDADGHVGVFESGEAGAVPDGALTDDDLTDDRLAAARPPDPIRLLDWLGEGRDEHHVDLGEKKPPGNLLRGLARGRSGPFLAPTLLFLKSLDLVRREVDEHWADHEPASEGVAVLFLDLPVATAWKLHEAGACLGCFPWPRETHGFRLRNDRRRRLGLFRYDHGGEAENWISGPYVRLEPPARPMRIEDLPPDLREALGRVRFANLRFADSEKIQPIDHAPCQSWESAYLGLDGRTIRAIPGREAEFNPGEYSDDPRFLVEPPPPREGGADGP